MSILIFAKHLQDLKSELVFVGGVNKLIRGIKKCTSDIDVVVKDIKGLEILGEIYLYKTSYVGSISGNRAYIKSDYFIDIFIEDSIPEYDIIGGLKCQTLLQQKQHDQMVILRN